MDKFLIIKLLNLLCLLGAVVWLARAPDWEPAVTSFGLLAAFIAGELHNWKTSESSEAKSKFVPEWQSSIEELTGIVHIFSDFVSCEKEILTLIEKSNFVRIFLQIGKTVLAGNSNLNSNFYDYLGNAVKPTATVRILHGSIDSYYLSERTARERDSDYNEWVADLEHAIRKVDTLAKKTKASLEGRQHKEGFVWRLFIFEDYAYVQPYLYSQHNSKKAPVYKLSRLLTTSVDKEENPKSLYKAFLNYFDFKWDEYQPSVSTLTKLIPENDETSVAAIVKYSQFFIFAIPLRYMQRDAKELPFHGVGGKLKTGEDCITALKREVKEETGLDIVVQASARTRFLTSAAELSPLNLTDSPRPYCIYKRTREVDLNFIHPEVLWLIGYEGELEMKGLEELRPSSEIGSILCLSGDMLIKCLLEKVTIDDLNHSSDGSRIILRPDITIDKHVRIVPSGLATIAAFEQRPRLVKRL